MTCPAPRTIARALAVLERLPAPALALLAEMLIERLDALADTDADYDEEDAVVLASPDRWRAGGDGGAGDADDAEPEPEGCCEARVHDPAWSRPFYGKLGEGCAP